MAKKFSGFNNGITPDKASTSQFIVGYSGQDNAQWTINSLYNAFGLNGFITASSTDTLTNKSGSNSQWTNDENYITSSSLPTVNNNTITLVAGTGLTGGDSFTLNQGSNKTITFNASGTGTETIFSTNPTSTIPTGQSINLTDNIELVAPSGGYFQVKASTAGYGSIKLQPATTNTSVANVVMFTDAIRQRSNGVKAIAIGGDTASYVSINKPGTYFWQNTIAALEVASPNATLPAIVARAGSDLSTGKALDVINNTGDDIFNVTGDGEVKIESNLSNYTGFRIKAANGASGTNATAYISDNYSGGTLQDIKPFLAKRATSGTSNRDTLFLGPASSTNVGYNNAGHTVVNGPWQGGVPSFNTAAAYFAPMITSSMFIAGGGNETGLFIGSGGQDSSHYALQVRSDNAHLNGSVWFQLRGDDRMVYKDGNEAVGKVLTCDADGVATWQTGGGDSIYTADGNIPTATNRTVTLTGTATLAFYGAQNQGDFRIGFDQGSTSRGRSNYSIQQSGDVINTYCYQSNHYVASNSDPLNSGYSAGINYLSVSAQGLEHHKASVGVGINGTTNDRLVVKGRGLTSGKYSVRVTDANDDSMFSIRDDGAITLGKGAIIQSTSNPQYSVVIGYGAKDKSTAGNGVEAVAIGRIAVGNSGSVAIGGIAKALGTSSVAIGAAAEAAATGTSVGYQAGGASAGSSAVSIGKFAQAKATGSIAIGANTGLTGANSIVLNATTGVTASTAADTFEVFMSSNSVPDFKIKGTSTGNQASFVGQVKSGFKNSTSTFAFDWDEGNVQKSTATGAQTFSASNALAGSTYILIIGTPTVTWGASVKWPGGTDPVLAGTTNIITLLYEGQGVYYGTSVLNYS